MRHVESRHERRIKGPFHFIRVEGFFGSRSALAAKLKLLARQIESGKWESMGRATNVMDSDRRTYYETNYRVPR